MREELKPDQLYRYADAAAVANASREHESRIRSAFAQERGIEAIKMALRVSRQGYNIFLLGSAGPVRLNLARQVLEEEAATLPPALDWCYMHNFERPRSPKAVALPAGMACELDRDLESLAESGRQAMRKAVEGEEFQSRVTSLHESGHTSELNELKKRANRAGFELRKVGIKALIEPAPDVQIDELPGKERKAAQAQLEAFQEELDEVTRQVPRHLRERQEQFEKLQHDVVELTVRPLFDELESKYSEHPAVLEVLNQIEKDLPRYIVRINRARSETTQETSQDESLQPPRDLRYRLNVLANRTDSGAPIVYEPNPTYENLVGRIERRVSQGGVSMDFMTIREGALHRANGGYLILSARRLLVRPYAWDALKQALENGEIRIETPAAYPRGSGTPMSLEPAPIPLTLKVVLLGAPALYERLSRTDPDFDLLFKVPAELAARIERTFDNETRYAEVAHEFARNRKLLALTPEGIARAIEYSSRSIGDATRLPTNLAALLDMLAEADYWAHKRSASTIDAEDLDRAMEARDFHHNWLPDHLLKEIAAGTIRLETRGTRVGVINGLSVISRGNHSFGKASRVTATVGIGRKGVVDIEREVQLGGPSHTKGVLILSGFLAARYARARPFCLQASLVMEQSYGRVDGDSASSTELYALLSALADAPIRQSLAVTGSVNQLGEVQAIGGVNEKIEGFFDTCQVLGAQGDEGVIIPTSNERNLMLRRDVIDAVEAGRFHIYGVDHIDEGVEILMGEPAGAPDADGNFPAGSLNARVQERLSAFADAYLEEPS